MSPSNNAQPRKFSAKSRRDPLSEITRPPGLRIQIVRTSAMRMNTPWAAAGPVQDLGPSLRQRAAGYLQAQVGARFLVARAEPK
jgi:hypothetical protein